jgi:hypothetical protein
LAWNTSLGNKKKGHNIRRGQPSFVDQVQKEKREAVQISLVLIRCAFIHSPFDLVERLVIRFLSLCP